jgi:hypothetical protein
MTGTVKITLNAMKDYVDGIYEIKITAEHFETAFVTFTILIQPFPEVEITNNNLQIGVNNSSATLKVTEYYTDTFIIPTVSIDYSESQTNFVISE